MSPAELQTWAAFYELEPWGYHIANFRAALGPFVASKLAHSRAGKRYPGKLEDFIRQPPVQPRKRATPTAVLAALGLRYPPKP